MEELKKIIEFILDNDGFTNEELFNKFSHLFENPDEDLLYGIYLNDYYNLTHLDSTSKDKIKRYEIKISKQIQS